MDSIKDKVAIVGMGCVRFGENWEQSLEDMIIDAVYEAYEDAGIGPEDIQAAWWGTIFAGETGQIVATPLKLAYIPVTHVENACATGSEAIRQACYAVAAGVYDVVLAVGAEKLKDFGYSGLPQTRPVATWSYRIPAQTPAAGFAMMATGYFARYGLDFEEGKKLLGQIAVKNHHNGCLNPKAHFQNELTIDQVVNAPIVALMRRVWWLAIIGGILGVLPSPGWLFGVPGLILVSISKREFDYREVLTEERAGMMEPTGRPAVNTATMHTYLRGLNYPADKSMITNVARSNAAPDAVMMYMNRLPDRAYMNSAEIDEEFSKIR
jgi:hypothetical protein